MFRRCVPCYRHRTAAAFSRAERLFTGSVQEEMLRHVSCDAAVYLMLVPVLRVGDVSLLPPQEAGDDELQGDG